MAKVFRLSDVRRRNRDAVRRWRERSRKCQAAYYVDADDRVLSMLIRRRYIDEHQAADKDAVRRALTVVPQPRHRSHLFAPVRCSSLER